MKNKPVWRKGPPPSVGWWPASIARNQSDYRWWNGKTWSLPLSKKETKDKVEETAASEALWPLEVEWTDRPASWPKRSRT